MNDNLVDINEVMRNTRRYWYVDGINEIAGGFLIVFIALSYYLSSIIPNVVVRSVVLGIGQPIVIILGSVMVSKLVKRIKESFTYPRTGYLSFRRQGSRRFRRTLNIILIAVIVSVIVSVFAQLMPEQMIPLMTAVFMAALTIYLGYQYNVPRFYVVSVLCIAWGAFMSWWYPAGVLPFVFMFGGVGILWIVSGLTALIRYLKETGPVEREA